MLDIIKHFKKHKRSKNLINQKPQKAHPWNTVEGKLRNKMFLKHKRNKKKMLAIANISGILKS